MIRQKITSSWIAEVGYDHGTQTLEIAMKPRGDNAASEVWQYSPVPIAVYETMIDPAQSAGKAFALIRNEIKSGEVGELRVGEEVLA